MSSPRRFQALELVTQAAQRGTSATVLVEGEEDLSDAWLLGQMLRPFAQQISFHGRGSWVDVIRDLEHLLPYSPPDQVFAVLDRDFASDEEVETCYAPGYRGHLFRWRRYTIENYLLEPDWIAEFVDTVLETVPPKLATPESVEKLMLGWCARLAPQVAGNWVIADLTRETMRRNLRVEARQYFEALTDRDSTWVLAELTKKYGGWGATYPALFTPDALQSRFQDRFAKIMAKIQLLSGAHEVINGRMLLKAFQAELPSSLRAYVRKPLILEASKQVPEDIRVLFEERILPRWRRAREGQA